MVYIFQERAELEMSRIQLRGSEESRTLCKYLIYIQCKEKSIEACVGILYRGYFMSDSVHVLPLYFTFELINFTFYI